MSSFCLHDDHPVCKNMEKPFCFSWRRSAYYNVTSLKLYTTGNGYHFVSILCGPQLLKPDGLFWKHLSIFGSFLSEWKTKNENIRFPFFSFLVQCQFLTFRFPSKFSRLIYKGSECNWRTFQWKKESENAQDSRASIQPFLYEFSLISLSFPTKKRVWKLPQKSHLIFFSLFVILYRIPTSFLYFFFIPSKKKSSKISFNL